MITLRTIIVLLAGSVSGFALGDTTMAEIGSIRAVRERIEERTFFSKALQREVSFTVVSPEKPAGKAEGGWPVLLLLHGHGRNHRTLIDDEPNRLLLLQQGYLIVCPDGRNGWYVNSPVSSASRYADYLDELCHFVELEYPVTKDEKRWAVAGWSMGGYGAIRTAIRQPGRFGFVASAIGLLDFPREEGLPRGQRYRVPRDVFGEDPAVWTQFNPIFEVDKLRELPVYLVVAREAFDFTMNENFIKAAQVARVPVKVEYIIGGHTVDTRNRALPLLLNAVALNFASSP